MLGSGPRALIATFISIVQCHRDIYTYLSFFSLRPTSYSYCRCCFPLFPHLAPPPVQMVATPLSPPASPPASTGISGNAPPAAVDPKTRRDKDEYRALLAHRPFPSAAERAKGCSEAPPTSYKTPPLLIMSLKSVSVVFSSV